MSSHRREPPLHHHRREHRVQIQDQQTHGSLDRLDQDRQHAQSRALSLFLPQSLEVGPKIA